MCRCLTPTAKSTTLGNLHTCHPIVLYIILLCHASLPSLLPSSLPIIIFFLPFFTTHIQQFIPLKTSCLQISLLHLHITQPAHLYSSPLSLFFFPYFILSFASFFYLCSPLNPLNPLNPTTPLSTPVSSSGSPPSLPIPHAPTPLFSPSSLLLPLFYFIGKGQLLIVSVGSESAQATPNLVGLAH